MSPPLSTSLDSTMNADEPSERMGTERVLYERLFVDPTFAQRAFDDRSFGDQGRNAIDEP
jgi:hypothetical protein